ncbi:MAG: hypothetical protein K5770_07295 [Lachnospiraceae bacterium]|nr:hypothetical protein [Lachnospiraceae bacterium]
MQLNLNTTNNKTYNAGSRKDQKPEVIERSFGMDFTETVNIIFLGILLACLLTAVVVYLLGGSFKGSESGGDSASVKASRGPSFSGKVEKKLYAERDILVNSPTIDGIMVELLDNYVLGYDEDGETEKTDPSAISADDSSAQPADDAGTIITTNEPDAGETVTQTGASMILDGGQGMEGYTEAASHEELVTQIETALAANDHDFVGMKLAYKDDYGDLKGYPQSVVSHFVEYMSANAGKRGDFISRIKDESFSAVNDSAYIIVLPVIKFTVNMSYDDTTVSVPGFGDQIVNSGQSAVIQPLLPCMYSVTLSNAGWSQPVTREIETSLDELSYSLSVS